MNQMNQICTAISEIAVKALLYEVSATPKPGLVDRINAGAHKDMDFFTFMRSSAALPFVFYNCALVGYEFQGDRLPDMLQDLRILGIEGEKRMFNATNGVNTHKGLIFSLSMISAAAGYLIGKGGNSRPDAGQICKTVSKISCGITENDFKNIEKKQQLTYGERLFKEYGIKGIRGEVEAGFPTVLKSGIPVLKKYMNIEEYTINEVLVHTLINLMEAAEDSNILGRHSIKTLDYVKGKASEILAKGSVFTQKGIREIEELDKEFIKMNISPGGSADLLAIALMLYFLEAEL